MLIGVFFAAISLLAIGIGFGSLFLGLIPPITGALLVGWLGGMGTAIVITYFRTIIKNAK